MKKIVESVCIVLLALLFSSCPSGSGGGNPTGGNEGSGGVDYFIIKATNGSTFVGFGDMSNLYNTEPDPISIELQYGLITDFAYPEWVSDTELHYQASEQLSDYTLTVPDEYFVNGSGTYTAEPSASLFVELDGSTPYDTFEVTLNGGTFEDIQRLNAVTAYIRGLHVEDDDYTTWITKYTRTTETTAIISTFDSIGDDITVLIPAPFVNDATSFTVKPSHSLRQEVTFSDAPTSMTITLTGATFDTTLTGPLDDEYYTSTIYDEQGDKTGVWSDNHEVISITDNELVIEAKGGSATRKALILLRQTMLTTTSNNMSMTVIPNYN